jgi:outer membrane lipoprotein-sorting protein
MRARITTSDYTAIIRESRTESGTIAMKKLKGKNVALLINFLTPEPRGFSYRDKKVEMFYPKANTVQVIDVGKFDAALTQGLLIGFGASSNELLASYQIKLAGEPDLSGARSALLELTPKTANVSQHIKHIEMWLDPATGHPRQVKIHKPSGDSTTIAYAEIQMAPNLPEDQVRLKLPKDVKRENAR